MSDLDDSYTEPVLDSLKSVRQETGHSWSQVFGDWTDVVFATLQRDDDSHSKMVDRYADGFGEDTTHDVFMSYSEAFANLLGSMEKTDMDILGHLYQEYGAPSSENGQYFTPSAAAQLLSGVMLPSNEEIQNTTRDDPLTIHDPTCGSGSLLISAAKQIEESTDTPYAALFFGQDIDIRCVKMTAINFAIRGLPGYAIHGDSLKADPIAAWKVMPSKGLMNAPIQECEPPQPTVASNDEATDDSTTPPAAENECELKEQQIQVGMDTELDSQQVNFATFADDSDQ